MAKKKVDPKAKQRKQLIILGGLLLFTIPIFVMFTLPALTGGGGSAAPKINTVGAEGAPAPGPAAGAPAAPTTMAPPTLAGAAPAVPGAQPVAAVVGGDGIPETDPSIPPTGGQLVTFDLFETKDPFLAQVGAPKPESETAGVPAPTVVDAGAAAQPETGGSTTPAVPGGGAVTEPAPNETPSAPTTPPPATPSTPATAPAAATYTTAKISVNGVAEDVAANGTFPKDDSVFRLVSLAKDSVQIAIVGGSYQSGAKTVKLTKAQPLTLMNTAEGTRYEIVLVSVS